MDRMIPMWLYFFPVAFLIIQGIAGWVVIWNLEKENEELEKQLENSIPKSV